MFPPSEQGFSSAFPLFRLLLSVSRVFRPQRAGTIGNRQGFQFRQFSSSRPSAGPAPTLRHLVSGPRVHIPLPVLRAQGRFGISASHHASVSGRARHHERKPLASVSERGSQCTIRESVENEKKKKKGGGRCIPEQRRAPEQGEGEITSQSKARGRVRPRAMGERVCPKVWCEREGAASW